MTFMHNLQPWIFDEAPWEVGYVSGSTPAAKVKPNEHQPDHVVPASAGDAEGALPNPTHKEAYHASDGEEVHSAE